MPINTKKRSIYRRPKNIDLTPYQPPHPDEAPTISIVTPTAASTVIGNVLLSADVADDVGVAGVQFKVDGVNVGSEITTAPFQYTWNSALVADGAHNISGVVRDSIGQLTTSASVAVTVDNLVTLPDVIVTSVSYSAGVFTSVVQNTGSVATPSPHVIGVAYLVDGVQRTWGSVPGTLAAGASVTVGTNGGSYTIPDGDHVITAVADDINRFAESNETNNTLSANVTISSGTVIDDPAIKWYPGHYVKLEPWQVISGSALKKTGANSIGTVIGTAANNYKDGELYLIPALRGIKWPFAWGEMETSATVGNWAEWTTIAYLMQELYKFSIANPDRPRPRIMLAIGMKGGGVGQILPYDMRGLKVGSTTLYQYAWKHSGGGWYPKLWDATVQSRLNTFLQKLAAYVIPGMDGKTLDASDFLCMMSTLESATEAVGEFGYDGGSLATYEDGLREFCNKMKTNFPKTPVTFSLNYARPFIHKCITGISASPWTGIIAKKIGINTPNGNTAAGLITNSIPPTGYPGILRYFAIADLNIGSGQTETYAGKVLLNPEVQGDDYYATDGYDARQRVKTEALKASPNWAYIDAQYDFPSYESIYIRQRDYLKANYIVWQRTQPFWDQGTTYKENLKLAGGTTVNHEFPGARPKVTDFLKTNTAINSNVAGGLATIKPTNMT